MQTQASQTGALHPLLQQLSQDVGERVVVMDNDQPVAVVLSVQALENLQDELTWARYDLQKAQGTLVVVSQDEAKRRLGLA